MKLDVTLEELLSAGAHFGHQARRWNPRMSHFIFGVKEGVHIFDLIKTREALLLALEVLVKASKEGKKILFVGTKKQVRDLLKEMAQKTGSLYVTERWLGGTLTNFEQIRRSTRSLTEMKDALSAGKYADRTKKERLLIERKIEKLERFLGGLTNMDSTPDLMVIIDIHKEKGAVLEAKRLGIETIGVVDSNSDPSMVVHPIPMNDDASAALELIVSLFERALEEGKNKTATTKEKKVKKEEKKIKVTGEKDKDSEEEQLDLIHEKKNKK